jgi:glycogen debranching enzyme
MILRAGDSRDVRVGERFKQVETQQRQRRQPPQQPPSLAIQAAFPAEGPVARASAAASAASLANAAAAASPATQTIERGTADQDPSSLHDLHLAAASYFVERGRGATIVAGYPWFTDWGRDTFISLRGLTLHTGRHDLAAAILHEWAGCVSDGMLPNRFTDSGEAPEYNSVDASLWFIVALHAYLQTDHAAQSGEASRAALQDAANQILIGYSKGTRFAIGMQPDGLLHAGVSGSQLTWMDARVDGRAATPRIGKPVEIQALWINALRIASAWRPQWASFADRAQAAFTKRFVNPSSLADVSLPHPSAESAKPETGILFDVVDVDGCDGVLDDSLRPNQIFAAGGLPFRIVDAALAAKIVAQVERTLLTPMGLRTLAADDPRYFGQYIGPPEVRDEAYHQGTVWPWLLGGFVEAWLFVHASPTASPAQRAQARQQARVRFLAPLDAHLAQAGIGHISEIADGDAPHTPRGAPFQAWSLAERLRIESLLTGTE